MSEKTVQLLCTSKTIINKTGNLTVFQIMSRCVGLNKNTKEESFFCFSFSTNTAKALYFLHNQVF